MLSVTVYITEYYVLNAFDTLVHYQLEETGRVKNSSRKYWEQESITVVTVDADAILREMEEEIQKYSH